MPQSLLRIHIHLVISTKNRQREHHRGVSFKDEFRSMLREYDVAYDERRDWIGSPLQGSFVGVCQIPRAMPWAGEGCPVGADRV